MLRGRCCFTCAYWRAGASPAAGIPATDESHDDVGACENIVPQVFIISGGPVTLQPTTHATRCCADWRTAWHSEDDDDPGGGEPMPKPDHGRVRALFPIKSIPIAA